MFRFALLISAFVGCYHKPPQPPPILIVNPTDHEASDNNVIVSYTVERGKKKFTLPTGDPIKVGDKIKINFTASQTGYLYLFSIGPEGDVYLLVPSSVSNENRLYADNTFSFGSFPVIPPTGTETLYFLTTSEPVSAASLSAETDRLANYIHGNGAIEEFTWALNGAKYRGVSTTKSRSIGEVEYYPVPSDNDGDLMITIGILTLKSEP